MPFSPLTAVHFGVGIALLVLGLSLFRLPKLRNPWHGRMGEAYFWVLTFTVGSGLVDGVIRQLRQHTGISPFEVVTVPTWCFALLGYLVAKRRPKDWLRWHITGQAGSFIGVVTAGGFLFRGNLLPDTLAVNATIWAVPQIVGAALITRTTLAWVGPPRWLRERKRAS